MFGVWTSYTPTFGGFSANPTVSARYIQIGKTVIVAVYTTANGTSNATNFTVSTPVTSANIANMNWFTTCVLVNNGGTAATPGRVLISNNSTTITLTQDMTGTLWTASSTKGASFVLTYEAA